MESLLRYQLEMIHLSGNIGRLTSLSVDYLYTVLGVGVVNHRIPEPGFTTTAPLE